MSRPKSTNPMTAPQSVRLYPEQKKMLREAARRTRLSEQDCIRKAIELGLPALERALSQAA